MASLEKLRALCGGPRDGALLRVSIANALLDAGDRDGAIAALHEALRFDPLYSAAWKTLGRTFADGGQTREAIAAYQDGIAAARTQGDKQAEKEMLVFLKRLEKSAG